MTPLDAAADAVYQERLDWLYASLNERSGRTSALGDLAHRHPTWTRALLDSLGAPDRDLPALLVVGSKGKGSTATMAAAALGALGAPVGLSTSPHLVDVRERIRLDLRAIDPLDLSAALGALRPAADALRACMPMPAYQSPVGLLAVVAAMHFARRGARLAVYEAGRGGLVDDVAEVCHAVVAVTPILLEHRRELGPELRDIARHKAGAVRPGTHTVVTARLAPVAAAAVERRARAVGARRLALGRDVRVESRGETSDGRAQVTIATPFGARYRLTAPLAGRHQADNAAVALAAAEALAGRRLPAEAVARALSRVRWPGRLQVVRTAGGGHVLVDGAIEPDALGRALEHAAGHLPAPYAVVVGAGTDKAPERLWRHAADTGWPTVVTRARAPHLRFPADDIGRAFAAEEPSRRAYEPDLAGALERARHVVGPAGTVVVAGTLSLVGEALALLGEDVCDLAGPEA